MTEASTITLVIEKTRSLLEERGKSVPPLGADTVFLGEALPMDSLELATLVVLLEEETGREPFRAGFREFRTIGELAALFADSPG